VEVRARNFRQVKEPSHFDLEQVELRLYHEDASEFDQVRSAQAQFDTDQGVLYSDGEVEITMGVAAGSAPAGRLVFIRSSGVTFENKTGKASTDRLATFTFDQGQGKAVGAAYDPTIGELHLRSEAEVLWRGQGPNSKPMRVEAGEITYRERDSIILLSPWSRLKRGDLVLEGGRAIVTLEQGSIRLVEGNAARGTHRHPGRQVEYAAEHLMMYFSDVGEVEKITGEGDARLTSVSASSSTSVTADRVDMEFEIVSGDSQLRKVLAMGHSTVEARPLPSRGAAAPPARTLRSEVIQLEMRPGGREIQSVETHTPGSIEFLPSRPGHRRRRLDGERIWITYGSRNRIRSFRAVNVSTRTEALQPSGRPVSSVTLTWSNGLAAEFDPADAQLTRLEQWDNFRYQEGDRRARANRAVLDPRRNLITLEGTARLWDLTGSASADRILLDRDRGEFIAEGNVTSSLLPDPKRDSSAMLSANEPLQGKSDRMTSSDGHGLIRYQGNAVLWQAGNRIRGSWIEIDRSKRQLVARGNVTTQFIQRPEKTQHSGKPPGGQLFTIIQAPELLYDEQSRVARYRGGVKLSRTRVDVTASELRAHLADKGSGTQLERAYADGSVKIVHTMPGRTRQGVAEHAEYYTGAEKLVLHGGEAILVDSLRGSAHGKQLTWFINNDRLLVDGREDQPAVSLIHRK
jgi:lipopolysaccharide export system protein LptA